jgi:nucleoside-triphosphatase
VITAGPVRLIVTGEVGRGKTRTCGSTAARLRDLGWQVAGVLSPGVWLGDQKVAIDALDLRTGHSRRLAERAGAGRALAGPATRGWRFHAQTIAWCNSLLANTIDCDLLVVDELGPLEFKSGEGLIEGMRAVDAGRFRLGLVVVRPRLLQPAQARWPTAAVLALHELAESPAKVDQILAIAGATHPHPPG